jgi:hypothetical protein
MSRITTEVPSFVKGEPGFAGKLNQLGAVLIEVIKVVNELAEAIKAIQAATPAKATATRKAPTKAE